MYLNVGQMWECMDGLNGLFIMILILPAAGLLALIVEIRVHKYYDVKIISPATIGIIVKKTFFFKIYG
jgi:hypothetical protein